MAFALVVVGMTVPDPAAPIRVLIVDDHPIVREGIAALIERQADMVTVGEASSGEEAIACYAALLPDVTLMDVQMPGTGGIAAVEAIRRVRSRSDTSSLTSCLVLGAD